MNSIFMPCKTLGGNFKPTQNPPTFELVQLKWNNGWVAMHTNFRMEPKIQKVSVTKPSLIKNPQTFELV